MVSMCASYAEGSELDSQYERRMRNNLSKFLFLRGIKQTSNKIHLTDTRISEQKLHQYLKLFIIFKLINC